MLTPKDPLIKKEDQIIEPVLEPGEEPILDEDFDEYDDFDPYDDYYYEDDEYDPEDPAYTIDGELLN